MTYTQTAEQYIRIHIARNILNDTEIEDSALDVVRSDFERPAVIDASNIDEVWEALGDCDGWDYADDWLSEFRTSGIPSGIRACDNRYYDCKAVARRLDDGTWVGWTYWTGGGKHGEPASIDWLEYAYFVRVTDARATVERDFEKCEEPNAKDEMGSAAGCGHASADVDEADKLRRLLVMACERCEETYPIKGPDELSEWWLTSQGNAS